MIIRQAPISNSARARSTRSCKPFTYNQQSPKWAISIQGLSFYGKETPPSRLRTPLVQNASIAPGATNTVSVRLAAQLTPFDEEILLEWASTGVCYCLLMWTFHCQSPQPPRFKTRHILVTCPTAVVGFSGGLGWAIKIQEHFQSYQFLSSDGQDQRPISSRDSADYPAQHKPPRATSQTRLIASEDLGVWSEQDLSTPTGVAAGTTGLLPLSALYFPPENGECSNFEQVISSSEPFSGSGPHSSDRRGQIDEPMPHAISHRLSSVDSDSTDQFGSPSLTSGTTGQSTPAWDPESQYEDDSRDQQAVDYRIESLSRQRREAEASYARDGNPQPLFDVLDSAAQYNAVWSPSGFPRF